MNAISQSMGEFRELDTSEIALVSGGNFHEPQPGEEDPYSVRSYFFRINREILAAAGIFGNQEEESSSTEGGGAVDESDWIVVTADTSSAVFTGIPGANHFDLADLDDWEDHSVFFNGLDSIFGDWDTTYLGLSGAFVIGPAFEFSYDWGTGEASGSFAINVGFYAYGEAGLATDNEAAANQMNATDDDWHIVPLGGEAGGDSESGGVAAGGGVVVTDNPDTLD